MTSNHTHDVLGSTFGGCDATTNMIMNTPIMHPVKTPVMKRDGFGLDDGSKPHIEGRKYCVFSIAVRMRAWREKAISLKATVGVRLL